MPTPISALIVDDEEPGRINLRYALAQHSTWKIAAECANVAHARQALAHEAIDVVFLDIQMPGESGLKLAQELCAYDEPPLVIFVTAYHAHAIEAFELHALDYLLKPFDDQRLKLALERAELMLELQQRAPYGRALRHYLESKQQMEAGNSSGTPANKPSFWQQLTVRSVGKVEWIRLEDVAWISAAGNYVELHSGGRTILHRLPLSKLEEHLDPQTFLRVHRSAIVRVDQIAALAVLGDGNYTLRLRCGDELAVSERYVQELRARCGAP
jgi:two-component system LytT family response regulator